MIFMLSIIIYNINGLIMMRPPPLSAQGGTKDVMHSRVLGSEDTVNFQAKSAFERQNQAS